MFKATRGKGFQVTFPNGWTVSVQWGPHNYVKGRDLFGVYLDPAEMSAFGAKGQPDAEVAAWDANGTWFRLSESDDVAGWVSPVKVASLLAMFAQCGPEGPSTDSVRAVLNA